MCRLSTILIALVLWTLLIPNTLYAAGESEVISSFPIISGYYYSQAAGGDPTMGYTITNEGGIAFYDAMRHLGGIPGVGFPASGRFTLNGFVSQATQKAIFQWNPARGDVDLVNVFDVLSQAGLDGWLQAQKQTPPPFDNSADAGKSWGQVVARHQAELDWNPAIKARYFEDSDPISHFGLPQSYADEGNVLVIRCQRAVFQQWKVAVPWAKAGDVTVANGGDIAKEANILPKDALTPIGAAGLIVTPLNRPFLVRPDQIGLIRDAANRLAPSVVHILVDLGNNEGGEASGTIIDPNGLILTNAHVVAGAVSTLVILQNGKRFLATVVGTDTLADVALIRIGATGLPAVSVGQASALAENELVVGVGYSPLFPTPPSARVGAVLDIVPDIGNYTPVKFIASSNYMQPGDSGSPLTNLHGQVVGIVEGGPKRTDAIHPFTTLFVSLDSVIPIIHQIAATSKSIIRPYFGAVAVPWGQEDADQLQIPYTPGLLVIAVDRNSPASQVGLRPGYVITAVEGTATRTTASLVDILGRHSVGDAISVTAVNPGSGVRTVTLVLAAPPPVA